MSDQIKVDDLVMMIKGGPCCGKSKFIGIPRTVSHWVNNELAHCTSCGSSRFADGWVLSGDIFSDAYRLKKINPPSQGDTLPTRADLDQPVKEVV